MRDLFVLSILQQTPYKKAKEELEALYTVVGDKCRMQSIFKELQHDSLLEQFVELDSVLLREQKPQKLPVHDIKTNLTKCDEI